MNLPIFYTRDELLPYIINQYNINYGIEIGVRDGGFAELLLKNSHPNFKLLGIDIYKSGRIDIIKNIYGERYDFIHSSSVEASKKFDKESLKFVHIDASHKYEDVLDDLNHWFDKIEPGGFLSGDDYCYCNNPSEGEYGVVDAVEEFFKDKNLQLYITRLGVASKNERIELAKVVGKQVENNLRGLEYTENAFVPNWLIIKQ